MTKKIIADDINRENRLAIVSRKKKECCIHV